MKFKKACESQIKKIMEEFDFKKAQIIITALGWTWAHPCFNKPFNKPLQSIPDIDDIKSTAERLLNDARKQLKKSMKTRKEDEHYIATSIGTRGFTVEGEISFNDNIECPFVRFKLHFGLTSYNDGTHFYIKN